MRFVTTSKGKKSGTKAKFDNEINNISTVSGFNRIYTPQNGVRMDKNISKLQKVEGKHKSAINSEVEYKSTVDQVNISTNKESNITSGSNSIKKKNRFRVYSAHHNHFSRLHSGNKEPMNRKLLSSKVLVGRPKLNSISAKDWQMFSVKENNENEQNPLRSCCSAKKSKERMFMINNARRLYKQRKDIYENARHIDDALIESSKASMLVPYLMKHQKKSFCLGSGINSSFSNSFMNSMFRDTSLDVAQKQKETVIRDQQKKIEKEMKRRQLFVESKQKASLREYYRKEHDVKVNSKIMECLTVSEFEEYLKRRHQEIKYEKARKVLHQFLLGFVCKYKFKKRMKLRNEKATIIQRWYKNHWRYMHGVLKKRKQEAIKIVEAHLRSYQVFLENRDFLHRMKLRRFFLFFADLRDGLLSKSQRIIRKHWFRVRDVIRERRKEQREYVRKALRKFTLMVYTQAK